MDVLEVLHKIGYTELADHGKEYRTRPLYRPSDNATSLCINKATGNWYDFSDRQGGSIMKLVKITMNFTTIEQVKQFLGDTSVEIPESSRHRYELAELKKFDKALLLKLTKDHSYWFNRGVSAKTVESFQGGIAHNGRMKNRYVFPILTVQDELIGFSGRNLTNNPDYPKWKHIGAKSNWCYPLKWNHDIINRTREVILLESIGDMLSLWEVGIKNTIVTFGVDISPRIIEYLLKVDISRILIAFNNDEDNNMVGNEAAEEGRFCLMKYFDAHQITVAIPDYKDFGEMNEEQINTWKQKFQVQS